MKVAFIGATGNVGSRTGTKAKEEAMYKHLILASALLLASIGLRPALAADAAQMEQNKKAVMALYDAALNKKDFDEASKYLGPRYTQHNPNAKDGLEGIKGFIAFLKEKYPNSHSEIKQIFADGDYVIVHVHTVREPGTRGLAVFDLFKLENARWSSIGTPCSRFPRPPRIATVCFEARVARMKSGAAIPHYACVPCGPRTASRRDDHVRFEHRLAHRLICKGRPLLESRAGGPAVPAGFAGADCALTSATAYARGPWSDSPTNRIRSEDAATSVWLERSPRDMVTQSPPITRQYRRLNGESMVSLAFAPLPNHLHKSLI
jgi:predicted SnoaL-like aldol condensation-catalyzing enzyme